MKSNEPTPQQWRGYTFDELQFRRISVLTRTAVTRQKIAENYSNISAGNLLIPRKLNGAVNYLKYIEYAAVAWRTYSRIRAIVRLFKRKK